MIYLILLLIFTIIYIIQKTDCYEYFEIKIPDLYFETKIPNAYVICLSNELFEKSKINIPFLNLKKFDAINGYDELNYFDPKLVSIAGYRSIVYDETRKLHADLGSWGSLGCALSHASLWNMIKKGEGMYIFESDAILVKNPAPFVQQFLTSCKNPHMLLLGSFEKHMDSDSYELNKIEGQFFGLHGYYITYTGAQILLKYLFPIEYQIDSYISNLLLLHEFMEIELNIWRVNPSICYQNNLEGTTIQTKNVLCPY